LQFVYFALACGCAIGVAPRWVLAQDRPSEAEMFGAPAAQSDEPSADAGAPPAPAGGTAPPEGAPPPSGAPEPAPALPLAATPPAGSSPSFDSRDDAILGGESRPMFESSPSAEDWLSIGGQIYLRAQSRTFAGEPVGDSVFNFPTLVDLYFDARPNDRVRGYVLGRMTYDPAAALGDRSRGR
jgi:hypothetical protein